MVRNRRGFSAVEFCVLTAAIIAGVMVMARFTQGMIQGSWRKAADTIGGGQVYSTGTGEGIRE